MQLKLEIITYVVRLTMTYRTQLEVLILNHQLDVQIINKSSPIKEIFLVKEVLAVGNQVSMPS